MLLGALNKIKENIKTMTNEKFIDNLLVFLRELGSLTLGVINGEPMHYLDLRAGGYDPDKIYKGFHNLRQRKIVRSVGGGRFVFTSHGQKWIQSKMARYFRDRYGKWDKKWRIIVFDIPQEMSLARQKFRRRIMSIGFHPIQKSVFAFPFPCQEEIGDIAKHLKIDRYVDVFVAECPGFKEKELLKLFDP